MTFSINFNLESNTTLELLTGVCKSSMMMRDIMFLLHLNIEIKEDGFFSKRCIMYIFYIFNLKDFRKFFWTSVYFVCVISCFSSFCD